MKRTVTIVAAAALGSCMLVPAAVAQNDSPNAKQIANVFCHEQKKAMKAETGSNKAFKELYNGGDRAMQTCKRENRGESEDILENASQECKAYSEFDPAGFTAEYGDKRNAHGKCVSDRATEQSEEEAQNLATAAHECRDYRETDEAGFTTEYGDGKNAFGRCVSDRAREEEGTAPTA